MSDSRPVLALVGGKGGHGEQLKRLRRLLEGQSVIAIIEEGLSWDFSDTVFYCPRVVDYHRPSFLKSTFYFFKAAFIALRVVQKMRPKVAVSTGPALAVPVCLLFKMFGTKVVHIESWSRISSVSKTTQIIRKLGIADVVVYQYPDSVLVGQRKCEYWGHL